MTTACACIARARMLADIPRRRVHDARDSVESRRALAIAGIVLAVLHGAYASAGINEWTAIGPEGARIVSLAFDPGTSKTAYAGTRDAGVLKSTDGGATWARAGHGMPNGTVNALAIDPARHATVYAGTRGMGVLKSLDGGEHWIPVNNGLGDAAVFSVNALARRITATPRTARCARK